MSEILYTPGKVFENFSRLANSIEEAHSTLSNIAASISGKQSPIYKKSDNEKPPNALIPGIVYAQGDLNQRLGQLQNSLNELARYLTPPLATETALDRASTEALARTLAPRSSQSVGAGDGGTRVA